MKTNLVQHLLRKRIPFCKTARAAKVLLLLGVVAVVSAQGQDLPFNSGSTGADGPFTVTPKINFSAVGYDSVKNQTVAIVNNSTWVMNGATWQWVNTGVPFSSPNAALTFDGVNVLAVGYGTSSTFYTYRWTGSAWATTTNINGMNNSANIVACGFDAGRKQLIVNLSYYSYYITAGNSGSWTYNYGSTTLSGAPSAYDAARLKLIAVASDASTWSWSGTSWQSVQTLTKPTSQGPMVYDPVRGEIVLLPNNAAETWGWDGSIWTKKSPRYQPAAGALVSLVYNPTDQKVYGYGSVGAWTWDGTNWLAINGDLVHFDMRARTNGIYNFTSVFVPVGTTLQFVPSSANSPVTWLASDAVTINGILDLKGQTGGTDNSPGKEARGGAGGFAGGLGGLPYSIPGSAGEGPGGGLPGTAQGAAGQTGQATASAYIQPLIGGSGGGGGAAGVNSTAGNGGGGGGAILIASSRDLTLAGSILVDGGAGTTGTNGSGSGGPGAGGSIRLVADRVMGNGLLSAKDGAGNQTGNGAGRIRVEAYDRSAVISFTPWPSVSVPVLNVFDQMTFTNQPTLTIASVSGTPVQQPPTGSLTSPDVVFSSAGDVTIVVTAQGVPDNTAVTGRITCNGTVINLPGDGQPTVVLTGGTATFTATVPKGVGTIQAFASFTK